MSTMSHRTSSLRNNFDNGGSGGGNGRVGAISAVSGLCNCPDSACAIFTPQMYNYDNYDLIISIFIS